MMILGCTQARVFEHLKEFESAPYNDLTALGADQRTLYKLIKFGLITKEERYPKTIYKINPSKKDFKYIIGNGTKIMMAKSIKIEREYDKRMEFDEEFKKQVGLDTHNSS